MNFLLGVGVCETLVESLVSIYNYCFMTLFNTYSSFYKALKMKSSNNFSKTLWIGDIENWMDEKFIYQTFSEYGNFIIYLAPVKGVKVMRDRNTGMALGKTTHFYIRIWICGVREY